MIKRIAFIFTYILVSLISKGANVDTVNVFSEKIKKNIPVVVITPEGYSKGSRYPVVYLLHGYSDNYSKWVKTVPSVKKLSDSYQYIIVCPDGGYGSWYLDSPLLKENQYETFISNELVGYVDKNYKTVKSREGRAITGLSMGGHGALLNAIKHQNLYACAGSMSGAVNLRFHNSPENIVGKIKKDVEGKIGPYNPNSKSWQENSVMNLAIKLKDSNLPVFIECGVDDFLIQDNRDLHSLLLKNNIPHDYAERPGSHSWDYWSNALAYQILFFSKYLKVDSRP